MDIILKKFVDNLIDKDFFTDRDSDKDESFTYKNYNNRVCNNWYLKNKIRKEIIIAYHALGDLVKMYDGNLLMKKFLENKKKLNMLSAPNCKYTLIDYLFCKFLEYKHPNVEINFTKIVDVDKYLFFDFDDDFLDHEIDYIHVTRSSKDYKYFLLRIEDPTDSRGYEFIRKGNGEWTLVIK